MSLYNFESARTEEQLKDMQDLDNKGICIFCPEHITNDGAKIFFETTHWIIKENKYPYKDTSVHLVLAPKEHVSTVSKLTEKAQKEFLIAVTKCEKDFKLSSYAVGIRSGDMRYNGASIEHLHAHIVAGDVNNPDHQPIRFKMSSKSK